VHTFEASWGKAYTAVAFAPILKLDSGGEVAARIAQFTARQPPGTLPFQPPEHMIFRAGGLTIKLGEEVIGAIGVGGAPRRMKLAREPGATKSATGFVDGAPRSARGRPSWVMRAMMQERPCRS
jgi:hypothetical protein